MNDWIQRHGMDGADIYVKAGIHAAIGVTHRRSESSAYIETELAGILRRSRQREIKTCQLDFQCALGLHSSVRLALV